MLRAWILRTSFILITLNSVLANEPPLRIAILEEQGQVDVAKPFKVEITNLTDQPIRIYDPRSAEGYRALSLVFTHKKTKQEKIAGAIEKVPQTERFHQYAKDISRPELRSKNLQCKTKTLVIEGNEKFHFYFYLRETNESERPDLGEIADWNMQVVYEPKSNADGAWFGRVLSPIEKSKLVCSGLEDPKTATRLSEPSALKLLDSDPRWTTAEYAQDMLKIGIALERPGIVRWAIKHKASPFLKMNRQSTDSFLTCPAARIENLDVLKVVWDEMPTRRDDLFFVICEVARHEIRVDTEQSKASIEAMLGWGAKSTLFSAIYLGDTDLVKSMLAHAETLPEEFRKFQDFGANSPLVWAVACERFEIAEWLIDRFKLDVNADYKTSGPLLAYATRSAKITELLCKHHASFNDLHPPGGYAGLVTWEMDATAIDYAAASGTPEVMETLLRNGGDLEFSPAEMHPLAIAAHEQNWLVLKMLATHPKFLKLDEKSRASILAEVKIEASASRSFKVSSAKRDAFAALGISDSLLDDIPRKVKQLLDSKGSRDDQRGDDARSLMTIALEENRIDVVTQLLDAGYDQVIGHTEFHNALTADNSEALQLFAVRCNFEFEVCRDDLLRVAAACGDFASVKWLIEHGASPDATDERGVNARDLAKKHKESVTSAEVERLLQGKRPKD